MMAEMKEFRTLNSGCMGSLCKWGPLCNYCPLFTGFASGKRDAGRCSVSTASIWKDARDHDPGHKRRGLGLPQVWGHCPGKHPPQTSQLLVSAFRLHSQKVDMQDGADKLPLIRGK